METWKTWPGDSRYQVSDQGAVRGAYGKILKHGVKADGRHEVSTYVDGAKVTRKVHVMVLETFVGPRPSPAHEARHRNGQPGDNRVANLQWGTKSENTLDSVAHGTHNNASKTHCKHDHEFTEANTIWSHGKRQCRECKNRWMREHRQKAKGK